MSPKIDLRVHVDPLTSDASFVIDDIPYRLCFDYQALYEFYKSMGVNPVIEPIGADPARFAGLLFVGLLRYQPEITTDIVKSWFRSGPMSAALFELTFSALRGQGPDPEPGEPPADPPSA